MSTRLALAGLVSGVIAVLGFSSSAGAAGIDVTPVSASVAPGETIEFRADPDQSCWRPEGVLTTAVYQWSVTNSSNAVVIGPTNVVGTDFVGGLLTIAVTAPQDPGNYTFNWVGINECVDDDATAPFVVTGTATTTTVTATTAAPTTAAPTTTAAAIIPPAPTTIAAVTLPATGQTSDGLVWAALAAILLGGGLVMTAARRS